MITLLTNHCGGFSPGVSLKRTARLAAAAVAACVALAACGGNKDKNAEVNSVIAELDAFTKELVGKVKAAPSPSAGVDEAQKFLDARRADVAAKLNSIKVMLSEAQLSEGTRKKLEERITEDVMSVTQLHIDYIDESFRDPAFKAKLDRLTQDYQALFKM